MLRSRLALALAALGLLAPAAVAADTPTATTLYETGPSGRYLIDGDWSFRLGKTAAKRVEVPHSWNVTDYSNASFVGTIGRYRKDFELPSSSKANAWIVRFESVNYRSRVFLNGTEIGRNEGAYLPFEVRLPGRLLRYKGTNRLEVRVDNRRTEDDLPPMGYSLSRNEPTGGWWNYGGILREVYLRRVASVDLSTVQVLPDLPCRTCPATITVKAFARNLDPLAVPVALTGTFGTQAFSMGARTIGPGESHTFTAKVKVANPELWSPNDPNLYDVELTARVAGAVAQTWETRSGIRSVKVVAGRLHLNGQPLNWRGFGLHEDSLDKGFALDNAQRQQIADWVKDLGGTLMRSHYPLHPQLMEIADRDGLMVWSEVPMYQVRTNALKHAFVRNKGVDMVARNILANGNHPSVIVWSIANELNSEVSADQGAYIKKATRTARRLDPSRPVGQAVASNPTLPCQKRFAPLDIIGFNEYFDWYPGEDGTMAERDNLGLFLEKVRRCHPDQAIAVTEFGAEANRIGPVEERGTYEFQQAFVNFHLEEIAKHPWLSGATYWALQEFRVRPNWDGGNPRPNPPFHQKGIITLTGEKKPAYFDIQRLFRAVEQFPAG